MSHDGVPTPMADPCAGEDLNVALSTVRRLRESRERSRSTPGRGDRGTGLTLGAGVLFCAAILVALGPRPTSFEIGVLAVLTALYAFAYLTEIVLPGGSAVPTQPVVVGLLLACPPSVTPAAVLIGVHLAESLAGANRGGGRRERALGVVVRSNAAWSSVAPAIVLWAAGPSPPSAGRIPLYLFAFVAQVVMDWAIALIRATSLALPPRTVLPSLVWTLGIDACLAPIGLCAVLAGGVHSGFLLVLGAPTGLVRLMAHDRTRQLNTAVAIGAAFDAVHEEARVDSLTGLANRRAWAEAVAAASDGGHDSVGALIADVDGLKLVNDTLGHGAGDELLRAISAVLISRAPAGALVARLGGDEFGVLVIGTRTEPVDAGTGRTLVEALSSTMAAHPGVGGLPLSASLGWASSPPALDVVTAVRRADQLAGEDKIRRRAGRDLLPAPREPTEPRVPTGEKNVDGR